MNGSMEDFRKQAWGVHPVLNVPDTFQPALIFSILDRDPRAKHEENRQRMSGNRGQQEAEPTPPMTPELLRELHLIVSWDTVFHDVPGDKMSLLFRNEGRQSGEQAGTPDRMYSVVIKSTEPPSTKWLVTRAAQFEGKAVCWCVPLEVEAGTNTEVLLTPQNMIRLGSN
jgi:hypothetical protein